VSTWDDKPNDYEHAAAQLVQCQLQLENAGYTLEKQWQDIMVLKDEVLQAKAESSAKRVVIVRLLDALSEIENTPDCTPAIVDIIHKAIAVT
jgi:hypothetical protein